MDDQKPANESNDQGLNKIDLTQLQDFTFGTQWTEAKVSPQQPRRDFDRGDRGDRRDRRPEGERSGPPRDRRGFRKPLGAPAAPGESAGPAGGPRPYGGGQGGERREFRGGGDRPPRGEGFRGGPRRDFQGGERRDFRGDRRDGGAPMERGPYVSPYFTMTCYPEDAGFAAMVKAVRASCRTFQLFEITKAVLEKNDRFVVVVQRKAEERAGKPGEAAALPVEKPGPLFMTVPDHLPFDTEEAAIQHVLRNHLAQFFDSTEAEVDAPKGNFPIINKCGITGELLGPPNYHKYQQILQQHHATRLGRMPFEKFRDSIVSAREPEVVQAWLDKMKKVTRYTWKTAAPKPAPAAPAAEAQAEGAPAPEPVAEAAEAPAAPAEVPAGPSFDSLEDARTYLLGNAKDKVVRAVETVRFHGKLIEKLPPGEIRRAIEGHVERQRRFPLDTANARRGRLRREGFTIFKKGSRGVSYVCAVKRRFRVPGQVFSETITTLIDFIEKNPLVHVKDLPLKFLGIDVAAAVAAAPAPAEGAPVQSQAPFAALPADQADKLRKMTNDLRWLVTEGYVTEFSDGTLFAAPPMSPQAAKKADEHGEEHDPVDFPTKPAETPAAEAAPAAEAPDAAASAPAEAAPEPVAEAPAPAPAAEEPKPEGQA